MFRKPKKGYRAKRIFVESHNIDTLAMLRNVILAIQYGMKYSIAQFLQGAEDYPEGSTSIVRLQILNVLEEDCGRLFLRKNASYVEE